MQAFEGTLGDCTNEGVGSRADGYKRNMGPAWPGGFGLFLLAFLTPGVSARPWGEEEVVGRVEIGVPQQEIYVLRATLPVPPDSWHGGGQVPFALRNPNGTLAPTQMEIVSRFAVAARGADVVELIARVRRPPNAEVGERMRYDVVHAPHLPGPFRADEVVDALVNTAGSVRLCTRDVFGNLYEADLLADLRLGTSELQRLKDGELVRQYRTSEVMLPVQVGASGTYPHFMGVHAFISLWGGERFLSLDLHVHNGLSGLDPNDPRDDALQKIYFDGLDLIVPKGWQVLTAFDSPSLGELELGPTENVLPLIEEGREGMMHVLPRQGQFVRRMVLVATGGAEAARHALYERGLAFCVAGSSESGKVLYSWWNKKTARYYPQRNILPSLEHLDLAGIRGNLAGQLQHFSNAVAAGIPPGYPVTSPPLGYTHPWGIKYGGQTGGDEIVLYDGLEVASARSSEGYRMAQLTLRLYMDRHRAALYNWNGEPTRDVDWLVEPAGGEAYVPIICHGVPNIEEADPFGFHDAPTFHDDEVERLGQLPPYEAALIAFQPIDLQHHIRYTRSLKTLVWLGNDALAKQELAMVAENMRLSYHEYANNPNGFIQGSGLRASQDYVASYPGWGFGFGRGNGWGLDAAVATYAIGGDALRARFLPWFEKIVDLVHAGQSTCTGIVQSQPSNKIAEGKYRVMQSFEEVITGNMLWGMRASVFKGQDPGRDQKLQQVIETSVYGLCSPTIWRDQLQGPVSWIALGPKSTAHPPFCDAPLREDAQAHDADHTMCWSAFAYAYQLSEDPLFLRKAREVAGGAELYNFLHSSGLQNLGSRAALLALVQQLH